MQYATLYCNHCDQDGVGRAEEWQVEMSKKGEMRKEGKLVGENTGIFS